MSKRKLVAYGHLKSYLQQALEQGKSIRPIKDALEGLLADLNVLMDGVDIQNPESLALAQTDQHWMKMAAFMCFKTMGKEPLNITVKDIEACTASFDGMPVMMVRGHYDGFILQVISQERANELAEQEKAAAEGPKS